MDASTLYRERDMLAGKRMQRKHLCTTSEVLLQPSIIMLLTFDLTCDLASEQSGMFEKYFAVLDLQHGAVRLSRAVLKVDSLFYGTFLNLQGRVINLPFK